MSIESLIIFFAMLFFLVVIHELGHFLFAKWMKMRVEEFAFGFPPTAYSKKIGETNYAFNMIPLGGYVKIFGENGLTHEELAALSDHDKKQLFGSKPIYARLLVLFGGVLFNILGAILLFAIAFMIGTKTYIPDDELTTFIGNRELLIVNINPQSPLANTNILPGSNIVAMEANGNKVSLEKNTNDWNRNTLRQFVVDNNNSEITIYFTKPKTDEVENVKAIPKAGLVPDKKVLGVEFADVGFRKLGFFGAFVEATKITYVQTVGIFVGIYDLVTRLINSETKVEDNLAGPIGLAVITSKVAEKGLDQFLVFAAMISLSLAVFNFLPIPALDGGRILFVLIEAVTRRKVRAEIEQIIHGLGFLLLLALMIFVSYFDIVKAFTN